MNITKLKLLAAAAVTCLTVVGGLLVAFSGGPPYTVRVYVLSADRLAPGNNVDSDGVPVGRVASVQLAPDNDAAGAIVTIEISGRYAPLRQGTQATIRPNGPVGDEFMELDAVRSGPPIPPGGSIPLQDTQVSVTLDQVTNVLNATTRQELRTLNRQGGIALRGRGADLNRLLAQLPQISADLAATTGSLDRQTGQLSELDAEFNRVAAMMASEHRGLAGDISNGAGVLNTLAAHQTSLQAELQHGNLSLGEANAALAGRQQDVRQLLLDMPGLLRVLRQLESNATTSAAIVNPCMQNLLTTLNYLANAGDYRQRAGSTDGTGYMLRVDPQLVGPETGTFHPSAACAGGGP